jgi:hypothetical protein
MSAARREAHRLERQDLDAQGVLQDPLGPQAAP